MQKFTSGGGLYRLVTPAGAKSWRLDYGFAGERRSKTLGAYPDKGLAEARTERDRIRGQVARGNDPEPKLAPAPEPQRPAVTFGDMVRICLDGLEKKGPAPATFQKNVRTGRRSGRTSQRCRSDPAEAVADFDRSLTPLPGWRLVPAIFAG
ncbi:Arm DNA-binding domain-containing protein [Jiella pacifica]|uniref:Integrase arm-type DNA-binding domain-containing protein n=1 Tax=Jiella pacifica TaxID=2696469 RepID=A0A6N9SYJ4_9HYPH|nr:integrase arm-type DNA-binding domain-containing protein [Jiella pacifica]